MNAYFLHKPDGTPTDYSACGNCGKLARGVTNFDISEKCCTCYECGKPMGKEKFAQNVLYHRECDQKRRQEVERQRLASATLVEDYAGPVFFDGGHGSYGEGYYENIEELAEEEDFPEDEEFAFCCESSGCSLDLDGILQNLTEELYEDARDDLNGVEELAAAVALFNEANSSILTWNADYKHKTRVLRGEK